MNKSHERDYGRAQRCAVAFHTARARLEEIRSAGKRGVADNGASDVERKREAQVLAILAERAAAFDEKFFQDFGKALAVLKAEGLDAFVTRKDEKRFVIRCARALWWNRFQNAPTLEQFRNFLSQCALAKPWTQGMKERALSETGTYLHGAETWTQAMKDCAAGLASHEKLKERFCKGLLFAKSERTRGETGRRKG